MDPRLPISRNRIVNYEHALVLSNSDKQRSHSVTRTVGVGDGFTADIEQKRALANGGQRIFAELPNRAQRDSLL